MNDDTKHKIKELDQSLGKTMKLLRKLRHLTQKDVAIDMGLSKQQIQKYESGKDRMSIATFTHLCKVLEFSTHFVLTLHDLQDQET
jgi:transcriptional regulator with XRE-family HTH domain